MDCNSGVEAAVGHIVHIGLVVAWDRVPVGAAEAAAPHCGEDNSALDVTSLSYPLLVVADCESRVN